MQSYGKHQRATQVWLKSKKDNSMIAQNVKFTAVKAATYLLFLHKL
jgi:hypothetical protein